MLASAVLFGPIHVTAGIDALTQMASPHVQPSVLGVRPVLLWGPFCSKRLTQVS